MSASAYNENPNSSAADAISYDELTVFQASPLVWQDSNRDFHPIEALDFEEERKVLAKSFEKAEGTGVKIKLSFETATTSGLLDFLATSQAQVLHFSCHGHPEYLFFEDGSGGVHFLTPDDLRELFVKGRKELRFVYVAACYSKATGEAFVKAGVPHVLCCEKDEAIMDTAAIEFCRNFYPALVCGKTLKDSFELGQQAVRLSPSIPDAENEMKKFLLLPKDGDHDIHVFFTRRQTRRSNVSASKVPLFSHANLPYPPRLFVGRELDMYRVLQEVRRPASFIKLKGSKGYGKLSLAAAVSRYILARDSFSIEEVIWLPFWRRSHQDKLSSSLDDLCSVLQDESLSENLEESHYINLCTVIFDILERTNVLFVIDLDPFLPNSKSISHFLNDTFKRVRDVRVILVCQEGSDISLEQSSVETEVYVGAMDFMDAAILFGKLCRYVSEQRCPQACTPKKFAELVTSGGESAIETSHQSQIIWGVIGEGIPAKIHKAAKEMTAADFEKLVVFAGKTDEEASASSLEPFRDTIPTLQLTDDESSSEDEIEDIIGVEFSALYMDDNLTWNENISKSKQHIEKQLKKLLKYGVSIDGVPKVEVEYVVQSGKDRVFVRLDCEIELREDLRRKDYKRVKVICRNIANLLRTAGASDKELEHLMIGAAWCGSLGLLLEAPLGVFDRLFSELSKAGKPIYIGPGGVFLVAMAPAFSVKVYPSLKKQAQQQLGYHHIGTSDVLLWKEQNLSLLIPMSKVARITLFSAGARCWDSDYDWRILVPAVATVKQDVTDNSELTKQNQADQWRKDGYCDMCGDTRTHKWSEGGQFLQLIPFEPITDWFAYKGHCLRCNGGMARLKLNLGEELNDAEKMSEVSRIKSDINAFIAKTGAEDSKARAEVIQELSELNEDLHVLDELRGMAETLNRDLDRAVLLNEIEIAEALSEQLDGVNAQIEVLQSTLKKSRKNVGFVLLKSLLSVGGGQLGLEFS